jgi:hypothetical protein
LVHRQFNPNQKAKMKNVLTVLFLCCVPFLVLADEPIIKIGKATSQREFRAAVAGGVVVAPPVVNPPPVVPPNPPAGDVKDFGPDLRKLFEDEWKGATGKTLKLPWAPGTVLTIWPVKNATTGLYNTGRHINVERLTDCTIDLNGCTIKAMLPQTILLLEQIRNVTLKNGRIEGSTDLSTTATWDASGKRFVIDAGKPTGESLYTVGTIPATSSGGKLTEDTIYREVFVQDMSRHRGDPAKYGTYKLVDRDWVLQSGEVPDFKNGAKVKLQLQNNDGHAIRPDNEDYIEGLKIEDITLCNIPGMAITGEHDGRVEIRRVKFERKAGADLAVASDGIHFDNSKPGVLIENCDLNYINDDFVNCNSKAGAITNIVGNTVTVSQIPEASGAINIGKWCDSGEKIVFTPRTATGKPTANGPVIAVKSTSKSTESKKAHTFTVDKTTGLTVGMICVNADRTTGNVIVRNCRFHNTRATGVKARSPNFQIYNNTITECFGTAIRFDAFTERGEGCDARNIQAWNNVVTGSGIRDDITKVGDSPQPYFVDQDEFAVEDVTVWAGERS